MDGREDSRKTIDLRDLSPAQREALFADAIRSARYERALAAETLGLRLWWRLRRLVRAARRPMPSQRRKQANGIAHTDCMPITI